MRSRPHRMLAFAAALAALAALAGASQTAHATYPGTTNGRLAFAINFGTGPDIYSVMPDGQALSQLTEGPSFDACTAYSADGKEIAFCSNRSGVFEIWKMKQNGTQEEQVTGLGARALFPDFSPDGSKIVFMSPVPGSPSPASEIFVIDTDGTGLVRLTNNPAEDAFPVFSPDGSKIAFLSDRTSPGVLQVWVMDADGTDPQQLTFDPAFKDQLPDWSPDGSKIAYESEGTGNGDIYIMNADGSGQTRLTTDPAVEFGAAWSPDGAQIAFVRVLSPTDRPVFVMNADGSDQHAVHPGGGQFVPAWQPRGDRIDD